MMSQVGLQFGALFHPRSVLLTSPLLVTIPDNVCRKVDNSESEVIQSGTPLRGYFVALPTNTPGLHTISLDCQIVNKVHLMLICRRANPIVEGKNSYTALICHIMSLLYMRYQKQCEREGDYTHTQNPNKTSKGCE